MRIQWNGNIFPFFSCLRLILNSVKQTLFQLTYSHPTQLSKALSTSEGTKYESFLDVHHFAFGKYKFVKQKGLAFSQVNEFCNSYFWQKYACVCVLNVQQFCVKINIFNIATLCTEIVLTY